MATEIRQLKNVILGAIGRSIVKRAKQLAPVDRGELRAKIRYEVRGGVLYIISASEHAEKMEFGAPPGKLDESEKQQIGEWAERHNVPKWAVIRKIERYGIEGSKYGGKRGVPYTAEAPFLSKGGTYRPALRPAIHQMTMPGEIKKTLTEALS